MKIAFYNIFGESKNAEQETLMRLQYVCRKEGHELVILNRDGYVIGEHPDCGKHAEDINLDFLFTYNGLNFALITLPDVFSVFLHWTPIGFVENFKSSLWIKMFHLYDHFACFYEQDLFEHVAQISVAPISPFASSVPGDYAIKPVRKDTRKLFYVGINFERAIDHMRYGELLKELDKTGRLEIYGPKKVYGKSNLWSGFQSYKGEIPFDGYSILEKISQAGICLALNSPMHNDAKGVSNRLFEAAAAGAVIISDDNEFVHKKFGDSVFYIEQDLCEQDAARKILDIVDYVNFHPEEAYQMACRTQEIFLDQLSLEKMLEDFIANTKKAMDRVHSVHQQGDDIIDIICFADCNKDIEHILMQLTKQYYQNLHLILVTDEETYRSSSIKYSHTFIPKGQMNKGNSFIEAMNCIQGKYFMFMDQYSVFHARHIYKNHEVITRKDELFVYSGCYLKLQNNPNKRYIVLNNKPIMRDEFLLFSTVSNGNKDWCYRDKQCFFIETIFARGAALFNRKLLEFVEPEELGHISEAVHFYLACCSLIKANRLGRFTYALTSGYCGDSVEEINHQIFGTSRRYWYSNGRSAKTYINEMNKVFFKYTFESFSDHIPHRNFDGEVIWSDEVPQIKFFSGKIFNGFKRILPAPIKAKIKHYLNIT